jgi:hypothetical protein
LTSRARLPGSGIAVLVPLCPLLLLVVRTRSRRRFRLVKSSKTFFRVGVGDQEAKSLRGIQRTQRDAVCRAPKWLKSSFQKLSDKCGAKGTIAYAPAHEDISYRPFRRRVRAHRATPTRRLPAGTSQDPPSARHLIPFRSIDVIESPPPPLPTRSSR